MRKISRLTAIILLNVFLASCGALTVAQRGEYIDQKSVPIGTPRKILLVKFGEPIDTETRDGLKTDIFRVLQGETTGSKVAKSVGIIFSDIITLCLAEIVADPVTKQKEYVSFEVTYDADDRVQVVKFFK
jgi:PBP1b-binding outer membrane lipoprotein LpoB